MQENIKRELQRKLKNNTFLRTQESVSGKLNPNKVSMAKVTKKVFTEKVPNTWKAYNVELLVDVSGSMFGGDLTTSMKTVKEIVAYFFGIINVNITFFDMCETPIKGIEALDLDVNNEYQFRTEMTKVSINGKPQYIRAKNGEGDGSMMSSGWNWEVCNLVSAWERIQKKEGEKIIIMLWDGAISVDYFEEHKMIEADLHFAGQPVARYNAETYKATVDTIKASGVPILPMCIWGNYYNEYFDNAVRLNRVDEAWNLILNFFKEEFDS